MWRVVSGIAVGVLILVAAGCTGDTAGAASSRQTKAETGAAVPQKAGTPAPLGTAGVQPRQPTGRVVSVAPVVEGRVKVAFTYTGAMQSRLQLAVAPKVYTRVEQILVDVGTEVKEGDPIAVMERAGLQLSVQQAEMNLKSAQSRLEMLMEGGRPEEVAAAEAALAGARSRLNQVKSGPTDADLQAAQSAVDAARASVSANEAKLEDVKLGATSADWGVALAAVETAKANIRSAEARLNQVRAGPTAAEVQAARSAVADSQSRLLSAQDTYETAQSDLSKVADRVTSVSQAGQQVQSAQAAYDAAVQKLNQLQAGPLATELQIAQGNHDAARAALDAAVARVDWMKRGPSTQELQQAQSGVDSARANLSAAQAKLAQVKKGPNPDEVAVAEAAVAQAEQVLALKRQPYSPQELQNARAAVDATAVALLIARSNLDDAVLDAPFPGTITQRVAPGAIASPIHPIATLVGSEEEIALTVEEGRLTSFKPGTAVPFTTPAYPGESFAGKVAAIAPSSEPKSRTFVVKITTDDSAGKLKPGMLAEVKGTAEERAGALLVPRDAVSRRGSRDVVFIVVDGKAQMRDVVQGVTEGEEIEIVSGVDPGEEVIVAGHRGLNDGDAVRVAGSGQSAEQPTPTRAPIRP